MVAGRSAVGRRVALVTDGAAALPEGLRAAHDIAVVPMRLDVERSRPSGAAGPGERVSTAAPSPGDFTAAIRARLDAGASGAAVLTVADSMSATHQSAALAAREIGERCRVVDTGTAAGGQALVVLAAAEAAASGLTLEAVVGRAELVAARVRLVATVPDLDHLVRSGRVPAIVGRAGRTIGVSPLFELRAGKVHVLRPARSAAAADDRMVARIGRSRVAGAGARVAVLHATAPDRAAALTARLASCDGVVQVFVSEFGPVMEAHTGPGLTGVAWWWDASLGNTGRALDRAGSRAE